MQKVILEFMRVHVLDLIHAGISKVILQFTKIAARSTGKLHYDPSVEQVIPNTFVT